MRKKTAHIILLIGDFVVFFVIYWFWKEIVSVFTGVAQDAESVGFNNRIGFSIFCVGLPIGHFFTIYEHFHPKTITKNSTLLNYAFVILGGILILSAIFISVYIKFHVERSGYTHCPKADYRLSFSTFLVYARDDNVCKQLEKEDRQGVDAISKIENKRTFQ